MNSTHEVVYVCDCVFVGFNKTQIKGTNPRWEAERFILETRLLITPVRKVSHLREKYGELSPDVFPIVYSKIMLSLRDSTNLMYKQLRCMKLMTRGGVY